MIDFEILSVMLKHALKLVERLDKSQEEQFLGDLRRIKTDLHIARKTLDHIIEVTKQ